MGRTEFFYKTTFNLTFGMGESVALVTSTAAAFVSAFVLTVTALASPDWVTETYFGARSRLEIGPSCCGMDHEFDGNRLRNQTANNLLCCNCGIAIEAV